MDNFREWLSDNLRYFMLGGAILVIVAVLFFGIRACVGSGKGASDEDQKTVQDNSQGNYLLLRKMMGRQTTGRKKMRIPWKKAVQMLLRSCIAITQL